jgi:hypothetical protein
MQRTVGITMAFWGKMNPESSSGARFVDFSWGGGVNSDYYFVVYRSNF